MLKETQVLLNQFGLNVISEARSKAPSTSGALADSLNYEIEISEDEFKVTFLSEPYGKFQDQGVQGADPSKIKGGFQKAPESPFKFGSGTGSGSLRGGIDRWVVRKGLDGVRDAEGRFISRKSMVYLISRSIYFTGLRPTLFFTQPFEKFNRRLIRGLERSLADDYETEFKVQIAGDNIIVK
jgi:hypothetical protein